MSENTVTITEERYMKIGQAMLEKVGVSKEHANIQMESLLDADQKEIYTHGLFRLPRYVQQLEQGYIHAQPEMAFVHEGPVVKVLDADYSLGAVAGHMAMNEAIKISSAKGVGVVAVRKSNHFGTAAFFAEMASKQQQIGLVFTNTSPQIAPTGTKKPIIGNNPWSISVPSSLGHPITLDMANSIVARGKMRIAAQKGEQIPLGWALDREGRPTTDPLEAIKGIVLPIGGYKGYGISLMIEILAGVLTGSDYAEKMVDLDVNQKRNVGHLFISLNIEQFMHFKQFVSRVDELVQFIKNAPRIKEEEEAFLPGEIEWKKKKVNERQKSVQLSLKTLDALRDLVRKHQIEMPVLK